MDTPSAQEAAMRLLILLGSTGGVIGTLLLLWVSYLIIRSIDRSSSRHLSDD